MPDHPARAVACPTCHAPIGRPCKRPSGHTIFGGNVHTDRGRLAGVHPNGQPISNDPPPHDTDMLQLWDACRNPLID